MFGKKENTSAFNPGLVLNLVGEGTEITGNINAEGDIRIDGKVKGNVVTRSKMVLGTNGIIEGDVSANSGDVSGKVTGNLTITEVLYLKASGSIDGNITTSKMIVESGGEFNGNCRMAIQQ